MKVFVQTPAPRGYHFDGNFAEWNTKLKDNAERLGKETIVVDLAGSDEWMDMVEGGDLFLARYSQGAATIPPSVWKPKLNKINELFRGNMFPSLNEIQEYDRKDLQYKKMLECNVPQPKTYICGESPSFVSEDYVVKKYSGSSSMEVEKYNHNDIQNIEGDYIIQEFLPDNSCDFRINIIGDYAMGYIRQNRDNDFRASGSGKNVYVADKLPIECIDIAASFSKRNNFSSMCYDFVLDKNKEWVCLEYSYTYVMSYIRKTGSRFSLENREWEKIGEPGEENNMLCPAKMIVEKIIQ